MLQLWNALAVHREDPTQRPPSSSGFLADSFSGHSCGACLCTSGRIVDRVFGQRIICSRPVGQHLDDLAGRSVDGDRCTICHYFGWIDFSAVPIDPKPSDLHTFGSCLCPDR